jgi:curli biogenesis system outer membrane secretion channel CsgG
MRRVLYVIALCGCIVMVLSGCAVFKPSARANTVGILSLPFYSGPKARIAVADFEIKAAKAGSEIVNELRQMLVTALIASNRFTVLEKQALSALTQGQELSTVEAAQEAGAQRGKIKAADIIVAVAVTEFEPPASGGRGGVGGGGGAGSGVLGALLGASLNKAHLALDVRIVNASTSEILASTQVQGQASDISGAIMKGSLGTGSLGAGLSNYANTPMEKAVRICIIEAVRYIAQSMPTHYYKY